MDENISVVSFQVPVLPPKPVITPSGAEAKTKKQLGMGLEVLLKAFSDYDSDLHIKLNSNNCWMK